MSNNLTTLRTALWTAFDNDSSLTTALRGGTRIRWASGLLVRRHIEPAMCPVLAMGPQSAHVPSLAAGGHDSRDEWRYTLRFDVHTAGQDVDEAEELAHQIISIMADEFPFSIDDLYAMDFQEFTFAPPTDQDQTPPIWHAWFLVDARYRIQ